MISVSFKVDGPDLGMAIIEQVLRSGSGALSSAELTRTDGLWRVSLGFTGHNAAPARDDLIRSLFESGRASTVTLFEAPGLDSAVEDFPSN